MTIPPLLSMLALSASLWATSAQQAAAQAPTVIRLQRTLCFGTCPAYTVTIDGRGVVTFEGEQFVRVAGRRTAQIDPSAVAQLIRRAEGMGFFDLRDEYLRITNPDGTETMVTDLPTTIVMITANGRTKRVEDYIGTPESLADFEREIDEVAGTKRWIFVDEPALDELLRSGWLASSEEGKRCCRRQSTVTRSRLPAR